MAVFIVVRQKAKDGTARFHVRWQPGRKHPQVHLGSFKTREEAELRKRRTELLIAQGRGFTCQYCGRSAPDVELQVDHVHPQSLGGATVLENLVTACVECNVGKSARVVQKLREAEENG
jgi:5-methylcytosine-specific restriction endonuclease McrA